MRSEGTDLWRGIWHRWILGRGGGVDGWSLTHHLDTVRLLVCVCVCVWNHKKVSHWSPDVNCWAELQKTRKWGDTVSGYSAHSLSLSCTCTQYNKPWEWWVIMEQTLTNLHLLARDSASESRQPVPLVSPSITQHSTFSRQRDQWPLLYTARFPEALICCRMTFTPVEFAAVTLWMYKPLPRSTGAGWVLNTASCSEPCHCVWPYNVQATAALDINSSVCLAIKYQSPTTHIPLPL